MGILTTGIQVVYGSCWRNSLSAGRQRKSSDIRVLYARRSDWPGEAEMNAEADMIGTRFDVEAR